MNFGPLSNSGGHRRLNVAITRARQRVEVVSSITAADMRHDAPGEGARHLRRYLDFAERGIDALTIEVAELGGDTESPFEEEVLRVVRSWGYDVVPQLGSAGYRIDLAVRHPERPGRFMLGIECDGAMYHSSRVARDRDRLRQEVLENLGWHIHRIWGTSWYRDRAGQESRLREALEAATQDEAESRAPKRTERRREVVHELVEVGGTPDWTQPYCVAEPRLATYLEMHEPAARSELRRMIGEVVAVEAPVSEEVVLRRVRGAWGVGRAGHRIRDAFDQATKDLVRKGGLRRDEDGFLWSEPPPPACVRTRSADDERTSRDVAEIPSVELALAVLNVVHDARRIDREELSVSVARLFGWGRRGNGITRALDHVVTHLLKEGLIVDAGSGWLAPTGGRRDESLMMPAPG